MYREIEREIGESEGQGAVRQRGRERERKSRYIGRVRVGRSDIFIHIYRERRRERERKREREIDEKEKKEGKEKVGYRPDLGQTLRIQISYLHGRPLVTACQIPFAIFTLVLTMVLIQRMVTQNTLRMYNCNQTLLINFKLELLAM